MSLINPAPNHKYPWWIRILIRKQRKQFGAPLRPILYWGTIPGALAGFLWMLRGFARRQSPLSGAHRALLRVHISQMLHCPFCIDLNMADALKVGLSIEKLEAISTYQENPLFNEQERIFLRYAEAVVRSDQTAVIELQNQLLSRLDHNAIIELTGFIVHQAMSALFNSAMGIEAQGLCRRNGV